MNERFTRRGLRLLDLCALVIGYSLAALLMRAYWPLAGDPTGPLAAVLGLVYVWLGLAMGGPLVLILERRAPLRAGETRTPQTFTWAELSWLVIGGYWIGLAILIVPTRLRINPLLEVLPIAAAIALRIFSRRQAPGISAGWTHRVAVGLLVAWPFAWAGMILLGKTLY